MTGLEKGKELFGKQKYKEAIEVLTQHLKEDVGNADALYTRGVSFRKIESYDNSVADFTTILERLPNEPTLLCERGISYFKNKEIEKALEDMDRAVELEPTNPFRYSSRAYIKAKTDIDGAMADYEKAIGLDPKDEISLNNLGLLQENAGKMRAAKRNFKKSNEILGYDPEKKLSNNEKTNKEEVTIQPNTQIEEDSLGKIMLSVFTSKKMRQDYFNYIKSIFKQQ